MGHQVCMEKDGEEISIGCIHTFTAFILLLHSVSCNCSQERTRTWAEYVMFLSATIPSAGPILLVIPAFQYSCHKAVSPGLILPVLYMICSMIHAQRKQHKLWAPFKASKLENRSASEPYLFICKSSDTIPCVK
jgi:hypothetical protein